MQLLGEMWKEMDASAKVDQFIPLLNLSQFMLQAPYEKKAEIAKQKYEVEKAAYKKAS